MVLQKVSTQARQDRGGFEGSLAECYSVLFSIKLLLVVVLNYSVLNKKHIKPH